MITALANLANQLGSHRVVLGTKIPHPCGDPELPPQLDRQLRRTIVLAALDSLTMEITEPVLITPGTGSSS